MMPTTYCQMPPPHATNEYYVCVCLYYIHTHAQTHGQRERENK